MPRTTRTIALSLGDAGELPTEFRLFVKGWNETENGRFLFDDDAAAAVMAAYRDWGVDLAIDLEHQMLDDAGSDPTARDARGWCKLELRGDGSLWAVDVRWTPDGAARLEAKRQRYVSPAFEIDRDTKRVTKVINVAITAMPATHRTPALVAASASGGSMDPSLVKQALEAIEKGDAKAALDILKGLVASAAGAEPDADGDQPGAEGDGAEGQPAREAEKVEDPKVVDSAETGDDDEDEDDDDDGPPSSKDGKEMRTYSAAPAKSPKAAARKAMIAMLKRETGAKTLAEALMRVQEYKAAYVSQDSERAKLARDRAAIEAEDRRKLCAELVKLGAEYPSTVWADDKATKLKSRWANMPIAELHTHVAEQRAARGGKKPAPTRDIRPAKISSSDPNVAALSADELRICEQLKCDPKDYAALKAFRDGKKG